jgi:hypothetical protein
MRNIICSAALLTTLAVAPVFAQEEEEEAQTEAPSAAPHGSGFYVGGGIGPAVHIEGWPTQFRFEEEIGYYVFDRPEGFFLAFTASESFASGWAITLAPRFGWMFNLYRRDVTFQLGPTITIPGFAVAGCDVPGCGQADAFFHFSPSIMARLLLLEEHLAIFFRPLEVEVAIGRYNTVRYVLTAGVYYHF